MGLKLEKLYTEEEYELLDHEGLIEYDNGKIIYMTPPLRIHQKISGQIFRKIGNYLDGKTCEVYAAPFNVRFKISSGIKRTEPDISVICDKSKLTLKGCDGAPDLIIEVVSPSNKMHDYKTKLSWYSEAGVKEYWIVDSDKQKILVYIFGQDEIYYYTFNDNVPLGIFNNDVSIDFNLIDLT